MTDKVQKIREEVEIVVNRRLNLLNGDYFDLNEETDGLTNEIMDIIDSMQEEPLSEDLEEAAEDYGIRQGAELKPFAIKYFKAGAQWLFERVKKALLSEVLLCFMHGGEADEVVAKLDEVLNQK